MAAAAPEDDGADMDPFSPSVFLDLPPTPDHRDGDGEVLALPDDLVLPYISRMLMEEDDMDEEQFLHQYPDRHPALLQAQQPFADILCSDIAAAETTGSGGFGCFFALSPSTSSSDSDPASPLDTLAAGGGAASNAYLLPRQQDDDGGSSLLRQQHQQSSASGTNTSVLFGGESRVSMDMVSQAFLKSMEEANNLLMAAASGSGGQSRKNGAAAAGGGGAALPSSQGSNCSRCRKHRELDDWDDGEEATGRSRKLVVPEQEQSGEEVDRAVIDGYALCMDQMESLRITMSTTTTESNKKTNDEAVDLCTALIRCAQAVSMDDRRGAAEQLLYIKLHSSPTGDADQKLAHCFADGLEARLAGTGSQLYGGTSAPLTAKAPRTTSVVEFLKAYRLYLSATCFKMTAYTFSNITIKRALVAAGDSGKKTTKKKLHIVDYGVDYGCQWPSLLYDLSKLSGGPPEVRMTFVELPEPGFRPAARAQETGRRLADFARRLGVPFTFRSVAAARWETVRARDLGIHPNRRDRGDGEVLVVNSLAQFQTLMDVDGAGATHAGHRPSSSPRDAVLRNVRDMRPDVFVLSVANASHSAPFFLTRFRDALFHYSAMFDVLDATAPRDDEQRLVVERDILGPCALNVVACEGSDRVERPETYRQWQARSVRAGLRQLPLCPDVIKALKERVRKQYHKDFVTDVDREWLVQGWKGRLLYAISTWVADE